MANVSVGPPTFGAGRSVAFDVGKAALVIVDMQRYFLQAADAPGRALVPAINEAVAAFHDANASVLYVNWGMRPDMLDWPGHSGVSGSSWQPPAAGSASAELWPGLDFNETKGDVRVDKYRETGFYRSQLDDILRFRGARTLFFGGVNTDQCVAGTMMDASRLGYDAFLVTDLTATTSPKSVYDATVYNSPYSVESAGLVAALAAAPKLAPLSGAR
eukprot:g496.t1